MDKETFVNTATPISVVVNGETLEGVPHKFSTGSVGYQATGKVNVILPNGVKERLQITGNWAIVGSKKWPEKPTEQVAA